MNTYLEKPFFDTLLYSQQLNSVGIQSAEAFTEALSHALKQNLFAKEEIEKMFAQILKESNERMDRRTEEIRQERLAYEKEMAKQRLAREKELERKMEKDIVEQRLAQEKELTRERLAMDKKLVEAELNFQKAMTRNLVTTISVLGSLIVLASAVSTFAHYFI